MAKQKHAYPDKLFVRYEADPGEEGYFLAETELSNHATVDSRVRIAVYRLEQLGDVSARPIFDPVKS